MLHGTLDDLAAFACVARLRNFTRAAAELSTSTSNLSHTIRRLEQRLGTRLLQRNSRSVAPSEAGLALLETLGPALQGIEGALDAIERKRGAVTGTVRITATRQAYDRVIRPVLPGFIASHPEAGVEVVIEYGYRDIIADGFDAGIRLGEKLQADMVALKVSPELRVAVPAYLEARGIPTDPRSLAGYRCINYRMIGSGAIYAWEFGRGDQEFEVRVTGPSRLQRAGLDAGRRAGRARHRLRAGARGGALPADGPADPPPGGMDAAFPWLLPLLPVTPTGPAGVRCLDPSAAG